jgi:hypothetical protein
MYCLIFDNNKEYMGLYEYFTHEHISNFKINNSGATYFFLLNTLPTQGEYHISEDETLVLRGSVKTIDNSIHVQRTFWWEKYMYPENVPAELETQINENLLHMYNGGSEETVPNQMPETQIISNKVENWITEETIVPYKVYIRN